MNLKKLRADPRPFAAYKDGGIVVTVYSGGNGGSLVLPCGNRLVWGRNENNNGGRCEQGD